MCHCSGCVKCGSPVCEHVLGYSRKHVIGGAECFRIYPIAAPAKPRFDRVRDVDFIALEDLQYIRIGRLVGSQRAANDDVESIAYDVAKHQPDDCRRRCRRGELTSLEV
ncbi:hypothetical protein GCM10009000_063850 [Halobacterium noricense]|uniref:SWIM-type domain-containing protein n=1 Tax=Haladaptatus pallidirubidus TaxID=1008152 RepID=A0AAV3UKC5_9EURY